MLEAPALAMLALLPPGFMKAAPASAGGSALGVKTWWIQCHSTCHGSHYCCLPCLCCHPSVRYHRFHDGESMCSHKSARRTLGFLTPH